MRLAVRYVVAGQIPAYLQCMIETVVPQPVSRQRIAALGAIAVLLAATVVLWAYYGTTVFFETVRAGFMACFG